MKPCVLAARLSQEFRVKSELLFDLKIAVWLFSVKIKSPTLYCEYEVGNTASDFILILLY